ncbi:MAG: NAD(P)-dependent oxidoreductase, partial [Alphaproteobacteria bacterium]|nr:NAD(P)-dependent oxidoreductase [Alphaproteobacteria bacterium]
RAVFESGGLAEGMGAGGIVIDQTTGDPNATRAMASELAERGIRLIDAPVSGGRQGADAGTIAIMVGASDADYAEVLPLLHAISPNVFHCGSTGAGHVMKLVNNAIAACVSAATFEAVAMGVKNGLDFARAAEVLNKASGRSYISENVLSALTAGPNSVGFGLALMHKDVRLATRLGADSGAPLFVANVVRELYQASLTHLGVEADSSELIHTMERNADVKVVP